MFPVTLELEKVRRHHKRRKDTDLKENTKTATDTREAPPSTDLQAPRPGSLRGNGLTPEKEISLAGLSPLQNTFLAFSLSNIPRFPLGRSITKSYFSFVLSSVCFMDGGLFT